MLSNPAVNSASSNSTASSLKSLLKRAIFEYKDGQTEKCIDEFRKLSKVVPELISTNEDLDDISSFDLLFVTVDAFLADCIMRASFGDLTVRMEMLKDCMRVLDSFFNLTFQLGFTSKPRVLSVEAREADGLPRRPSREEKISKRKRDLELKDKLKFYLDKTEDELASDDELMREFSMLMIQDAVRVAEEASDSLQLEFGMLKNLPPSSLSSGSADSRTDQSRTGNLSESERLDKLSARNTSDPLLDKGGRVQRPFVITSRQEQVSKVFRPDHSLPTLSIDEYLRREQERGNIVSGGGANQAPKSESTQEQKEDAQENDHEELLKQRRWDQFRDDNPKGWGNTKGNTG
eukprot:Partr_v1_DN27752_c0_g1_i3_m66964 putative Immunoglobulin (CD79A) binding protein 1